MTLPPQCNFRTFSSSQKEMLLLHCHILLPSQALGISSSGIGLSWIFHINGTIQYVGTASLCLSKNNNSMILVKCQKPKKTSNLWASAHSWTLSCSHLASAPQHHSAALGSAQCSSPGLHRYCSELPFSCRVVLTCDDGKPQCSLNGNMRPAQQCTVKFSKPILSLLLHFPLTKLHRKQE